MDTSAATYTYNPIGNRVRKDSGSSTEYFYFGSMIIAELNVSTSQFTNYVFFNGQRVARRDPTGSVFYYFTDLVHSSSVISDSAGVPKAETDYYPWGGELQIVNSDSNHYKFTGKERDSESGLDYFGARYYSNGLGRFMTADWSETPEPIPYSDFSDPQSLNVYSYTRNIPTTRIDADGHQGLAPASDDELYCSAVCAKPKPKPKPPKPPSPPPPPPELPPLPTFPLGPNEINQPCEFDCARAMINRLLQLLDFFDRARNGEVAFPSAQRPAQSINPLDPTKIKNLAKILQVLSVIDSTGQPPAGTVGGDPFQNDGRKGTQLLPPTDGHGNPIKYYEWDVNSKQPGVNRGSERIVTGTDGSAYYTDDHYHNFTKLR